MARPLAAHMGQDCARDLQQPKNVGLINASRFLVADLLHAAEQTNLEASDDVVLSPNTSMEPNFSKS